MHAAQVEVLSDGTVILDALARVGLRPLPQWSALGSPVVDRGAFAIFPLAVGPVHDSAAGRRILELESALQLHGIHFFGGDGFHAEMRLDLDAGYGKRLVETGAVTHMPIWWGIGRRAATPVRSIDVQSGVETLALHVIPKDWVWYSPLNAGTRREASRLRRLERERDALAGTADVTWSWPLAGQET